MTFQPVQIYSNVLDFYRSSGMPGLDTGRVQMTRHGPERVCGSAQYFEQTLYFLLGHLLPANTRLVGDLLVSRHSLTLHFRLPEFNPLGADGLIHGLREDTRFQRLLQAAGATCQVLAPDERAAHFRLDLTFPACQPDDLDFEPVIDFEELEDRFEALEVALPILHGFVSNVRTYLGQLQAAVDQADWITAHRLAHSIKGGALNIAAQPLARQARTIEAIIKDRQYCAIPDAVGHLVSACEELESVWEIHHEGIYG